ncbi:RsiW-degrading membrane proteinase PrsW (M82 family) [Ornithinimicrobium humiphilum]|uniref:RsiW-degrading membrane proteinase PrsW (M82 family) n=1 Tax=Ornithinimicrobium humiphilum TaxID=125288 RepID=A0A543KLY2_9MICO|nr:PrsW family intramembrane metalloprotease [Ornithinimicrobium humiphilum]TQM96070.1 RsiW-degrading membrane proteinase PrsW (M82 family) [Ornithinimicrobium humiphilum]
MLPPPHQPPTGAPHPPSTGPSAGTSGGSWQGVLAFQPDAPVPPNATHRPRLRGFVVTGVVVTLFGLAALVMGLIVYDVIGLAAAGLAMLTASIAIGIVVPTFLWIDRLEAEPARLLWFAFLWGALISTLGAIVLNQLGVDFVAGLDQDPMVVGAVVLAPLTEEFAKGLGVLLIFWRARREFNGVTDGIVYAGLVAAGFAFVENILYLGQAYVEMGTAGLVGLFVMRCLVSPFAHPMFTVCFGLALGLITHRRRWSAAWIPLLGFVSAVFLHGLWNYSAVVAADAYLLIFAVVQVPLFIAFLFLLRWARRRESVILRDTLTGYGINGWFTPAEVAMLASPGERRRARRWARSVGGRRAAAAMTSFQDESGELAMVRKHLNAEAGHPDPEWLGREQRLLQTIVAHRRVFVAGA